MRKITLIAMFLVLSTVIYGENILFMKPIFKGLNSGDAQKIEKDLLRILKKKYNFVHYDDIKRSIYKKLRRCGSRTSCWNRYGEIINVNFGLLTLVRLTEDDEAFVRIMVIDAEKEEIIDDLKIVYEYADDVSINKLWKQVRKVTDDVYGKIKKSSRSGRSRSDREAELRKRRQQEEERRARLEREREKKRQEARRRRREEIRRRKEAERKRRLEAERRRRKEEEQRKRLEAERRKREEERRRKNASKKQQLRANAKKLARARDLVLDMCARGDYNTAIKAIVRISEVKCECEEDAKVLALKTQLLNFNKMRNKILKGVKLLDPHLILDNLEAAKALDQSIVEGGTDFSDKVSKIYAIGYYAKAKEEEKNDNYVLANEFYEKCLQKDESKTECSDWLNSKDKIVKRLYSKAKVMKTFNPTKAKSIFRAILKLITAEHEYYKMAEKELQEMEN